MSSQDRHMPNWKRVVNRLEGVIKNALTKSMRLENQKDNSFATPTQPGSLCPSICLDIRACLEVYWPSSDAAARRSAELKQQGKKCNTEDQND